MKIKLLSITALLFSFCSSFSQTIEIYNDSTYQTIEGFGGFGPKKVWWDAAPYYDSTYLNQMIDDIGCNVIRTAIYWDGENTNDNNDPDVFNFDGYNFSSSSDNGKQFSFIKDLSKKGVRLIATIWTPPYWMKGMDEFYGTYNGNSVRRRPSAADLNSKCAWCGGAAGCLQVGGRLKEEYYAEYAEYLAAWVLTVKKETGVDVWAINIQNEPMFPNPFESNVVIPSEYAAIVKVVGEKFKKEGIKTTLFGPEHMGEWSWGNNKDYSREIMENTEIAPYLSFYAVHSYVDGVAADYGTADGWNDLHNNIAKKYNIPLWMTETSDFNKTGFDQGFSMAKGLHLALRFGRISGWVYWYMADVFVKNDTLQPIAYAFKNYYRFVRPGYVQIKSTTTDADLLVTAFKKELNYSIVIINNSASTKTFSLNLNQAILPKFFDVYRTSATDNCIKIGTVSNNTFSLPGNSITTLYYSDESPPSVPQNLSATKTTTTTVQLNWTASNDNVAVTGYEIYKNGELISTVNTTSYTVTGLTASTQYVFDVKAIDAAENKSSNATITITTSSVSTDESNPTAPQNLSATKNTTTTVQLNWTASNDNVAVTGYEIYKNGELISTVNTTSYTITGLTASTQYVFDVKAIDAAENKSSNATITITTSSVSIEHGHSKIITYPNPVINSKLTIDISGIINELANIELIDMSGIVQYSIQTITSNSFVIDIPQSLQGMYILCIQSINLNYHSQVLVLR